jgi:L-lactate dehydrogenase complex protein LldG
MASSARQNILQRIKQALAKPVPLPFPQSEKKQPIFQPPQDELDIVFAEAFIQLQGKFAFCFDEKDMQTQLQQLITEKQWAKIFCKDDEWNGLFSNTINLATCDAAITGCECLVARTGTIVMSAAEQSGRTVSVYAPIHICIAHTNQLVFDIEDALKMLTKKYDDHIPSLITFASGPSRTADIEKTLVTGVHGPKEVYLFLIDSPANNF